MRRQAEELARAQTQAEDEAKASQARAAAADAGAAVASLKAKTRSATCRRSTSSSSRPTSGSGWPTRSYQLYRRYLTMAIRSARLMQQAYNFETDQALDSIRAEYSDQRVNGLLGADAADGRHPVLHLRPDHVRAPASRSRCARPSRWRSATRYAFETQLRKTGVMEFETRIDDFDALLPRHVRRPHRGGRGRGRRDRAGARHLAARSRNGGISSYRTPRPRSSGPRRQPVQVPHPDARDARAVGLLRAPGQAVRAERRPACCGYSRAPGWRRPGGSSCRRRSTTSTTAR